MSIFTNQIGLNLTQEKIQLVEIVNKENKFYLENVDEEYFEDSIDLGTKESKFIHILQNSFNEIILRKPLTSNKISITLPPSFFKIFEIPVDKNLTKNDLKDYIEWELSKLFPNEKPNYFSYQSIILKTLNISEIKRVFVFAVPTELLKRVHKFCVRNNLQLKFIDNSQIAISQLLKNEHKEHTFLSLSIEEKLISSCVFSDDKIVYHKSKSFTSVAEVPEIISGILDSIKSRNILSAELTKIYLDGNLVSNELKNSIENSTNLSIIEFSPFNNFEVSSNLLNSKFVSEVSSKFNAPTAIALRIAS